MTEFIGMSDFFNSERLISESDLTRSGKVLPPPQVGQEFSPLLSTAGDPETLRWLIWSKSVNSGGGGRIVTALAYFEKMHGIGHCVKQSVCQVPMKRRVRQLRVERKLMLRFSTVQKLAHYSVRKSYHRVYDRSSINLVQS